MTKLAESPLHVHHDEDEAWYVLDGKLKFHVGDQVFEALPGTFVFGPMDRPIASASMSNQPECWSSHRRVVASKRSSRKGDWLSKGARVQFHPIRKS